MHKKIIAFTGKRGSGKSTCADYLVDHYGFLKVNFKDTLVEEVMLGFPDLLKILAKAYLRSDIRSLFDVKPYVPEIRALLQNYGTNIRRLDNKFYWVERWRERVSLFPDRNIVVDDVRFLNEANIVKQMGGEVIMVIRHGLVSNDLHPSEMEMDAIVPTHTWKAGDGVNNLYKLVDEFIQTSERNTGNKPA